MYIKERKPALTHTRKTGKINTPLLVPYPGLAMFMQDGATPHTETVNNESAFQGLREVLTQIRFLRDTGLFFHQMTHTPGIGNFSAKMPKIGNFFSAFSYIVKSNNTS